MSVLDPFLTADGLISLATLSAMEIVLGIDNVVFLSIMTAKVPPNRQKFTRSVGLALALLMRLGLLMAISWVMGLTKPLFTIIHPFSGRDLILLFGGLFLLGKSTHEIFEKLEVEREHGASDKPKSASIALVLVQIVILDIVFSLDSVITAIGMARHIPIMIAAMVIAMIVMLVFAGRIGNFVNAHPSMKILALSFLLLIGVMLVAEGMGQHINKGYIYFAMAFSLGVELVNMRLRVKNRKPVQLHEKYEEGAPSSSLVSGSRQ
ncbi:MAG: TerC family protein [Polyangiaceae bacterium]|nr:TerC family protein [Polyangiaceae bacterium]NUQ72976.1 TerC family protein [Polyangiaceae bacterium]